MSMWSKGEPETWKTERWGVLFWTIMIGFLIGAPLLVLWLKN